MLCLNIERGFVFLPAAVLCHSKTQIMYFSPRSQKSRQPGPIMAFDSLSTNGSCLGKSSTSLRLSRRPLSARLFAIRGGDNSILCFCCSL